MEQKTFLEKLQSSDDRTKTRWVVGISAVAMALVVVVWLNYFNGIVGQNPAVSAAAANIEGNFSFSKTAQDGLVYIYQGIVHKLGAITKPQDYLIKPNQ